MACGFESRCGFWLNWPLHRLLAGSAASIGRIGDGRGWRAIAWIGGLVGRVQKLPKRKDVPIPRVVGAPSRPSSCDECWAGWRWWG